MTTTAHLDRLNAPQRKAVCHGEPLPEKGYRSGPLLIIAGAGTGKTDTLAYRVAHLVLTAPTATDNCTLASVRSNAPASFVVGTNVVIIDVLIDDEVQGTTTTIKAQNHLEILSDNLDNVTQVNGSSSAWPTSTCSFKPKL